MKRIGMIIILVLLAGQFNFKNEVNDLEINHIPKSSNQEETFEINDIRNENATPSSSNISILDENFLEYVDQIMQYKHLKGRLKYYFQNLKQNFGNNQMGSCGYVTVGSILTYFDTFYNDDIVPENYDVISEANSTDEALENSPGSKFEVLDRSSLDKYWEEIENNKDDNLHNLMMSNYNEVSISTHDDAEVIKSVVPTNLKNSFEFFVLDLYSSACEENINSTFINIAKEIIDRGLPVNLSIGKRQNNNTLNALHSVVAYDYVGDDLYMHTGWMGSNTHLKLNQIPCDQYNYYDTIYAISIIVPKMNHTHSNNYKIYYDNGEQFYYFCPCGTTIGHTHEFTYQKYDSVQHIQTCIHCHEVQYRNHIYLSERATCICGEKNYLDRPPIIIGPGILSKEEEVTS